MGLDRVSIRDATTADIDAAADIARASRRHFLPFLSDLHTPEQDRIFYRQRVLPACEVRVAQIGTQIVGFIAFKADWVEHLYLSPSHVGRGLGTILLGEAKDRHDRLQLWVFQQNTAAIRFYERNGFRRIRETDGLSNEEKTPDALYEWCRSRA
ncbi:GNAT family N-acetyltransferase [Limimaricola pyoseonensis]|uniref:Ribosomal protein S18 acetylase RimI n=1 Tax=Limimaricola pyoseonensis TaxID=521013 RepID=A0A1G7LBH0_9RHOB|nr:GNAT family N-acetyltransferase [Limimaricola pyoseonensis]SDF46390.1 Ribosomal protein S18 acetylase RimI [Limimaricola pyoseonensis]